MKTIQDININLLRRNNNNPRKSFSDKVTSESKQFQTIEGLAENISEIGLINPLTVQPFGGAYEIIAGERRFQACKSLGWTEVPCLVINATPEEQRWIILSENLQRKDLSEVEKAEAIHDIQTVTGLPLRNIAKKIGVTHPYLVYLLQLYGYPEEVKEMVKSDEVSAKSIRPLSQLDTPTEQIKVAEHIRDNELSYKQAKTVVDQIKDLPPEVRSTLEEPEVSVKHVIVEVYDEDEETPLEKDYNTFLKAGQQLYDILTVENVKSFNSFDKIVMKRYLRSLQVRIGELLEVIDTL